MSLNTNEDFDTMQHKKVKNFRGLAHIIVGACIFLIGIFFLVRSHFNLNLNLIYKPDFTDKIIGVLFMLYGGFRIYRGVKK